jgi:CRISPR-associated protein Cas2
MKVVVAYDISSDASRKCVSDILEELMARVQYSVFEGEPPEPLLQAALQEAIRFVNAETDSIRVYRLCAACSPKIDVYGRSGPTTSTEPVRIL